MNLQQFPATSPSGWSKPSRAPWVRRTSSVQPTWKLAHLSNEVLRQKFPGVTDAQIARKRRGGDHVMVEGIDFIRG